MFRTVDLPQPLGPTIETEATGGDVEGDVLNSRVAGESPAGSLQEPPRTERSTRSIESLAARQCRVTNSFV